MSFAKILVVLLVGQTIFSVGCTKHEFENVGETPFTVPADKFEDFSRSQTTLYQPQKVIFTQDQFDSNQTQVFFQVFDRLGRGVLGLEKGDFLARENGVDFGKFSIDSSSQDLGKKVDIVFVLDVTNSMEKIINQVKDKVRDFAESFRLQKVDGTLCLVTFRDATVKKCLIITPDNPNTANDENIDKFFEEISAARTKPAGDWNEGQLRGLIDAVTLTPWRDLAQRMAVLITNSPFSYAPDHRGNAGGNAPSYQETVTALIDYGVTVFTIGPERTPGYDRKFNNQLEALHVINGGKYFPYARVLSGEISMEDIFNQIIDNVAANYRLDYVVEEQPGLKPELPMHERAVSVRTVETTYRLRLLNVKSNQPNGRSESRRQFVLPNSARAEQINFAVKVAGLMTLADVGHTQVNFSQAPAPGSTIEVTYDPENLLETTSAEPILLPANMDWISLKVKVNGYAVGLDKLGLYQNSNGEVVLDSNIFLADIADPYQVVKYGGLNIEVFGRVHVAENE